MKRLRDHLCDDAAPTPTCSQLSEGSRSIAKLKGIDRQLPRYVELRLKRKEPYVGGCSSAPVYQYAVEKV